MRHTIITEKERNTTLIVVVGATYFGGKMVQRGVLQQVFRGRCRPPPLGAWCPAGWVCTGCFGTLFWSKWHCCKEQALQMPGSAIRSSRAFDPF